jgi:hypothetical protein
MTDLSKWVKDWWNKLSDSDKTHYSKLYDELNAANEASRYSQSTRGNRPNTYVELNDAPDESTVNPSSLYATLTPGNHQNTDDPYASYGSPFQISIFGDDFHTM